MATWEIPPDEYLKRLGLNRDQFAKHLRLPALNDINSIVPLSTILQAESLIHITEEMLFFLLSRVQTLDGQFPYENATFKPVQLDPRQLAIGQRFVYREKYVRLLEHVPSIFSDFCVTNGGLSGFSPHFIFGVDQRNEHALACYLPPLVERHGDKLVIMDGIHRNFIAMQTGATLNAILIEGVSLPFPCGVRRWDDIKVISLSKKPAELNDRYFDLNVNLFRNLKHLGIDG